MSKIPSDGFRQQLFRDNAVRVKPDVKPDCGLIDPSDATFMPAICQHIAGRMFRDDGLGVSRHSFIPALISR